MKTATKLYKAALYLRLSKDDEGSGESASIGTQRKMLQSYAAENEFLVHDEYVDDGYSGTNFDRPGFRRMIEDIESGYVNMVITKDLSRLGREYIATGQYVEMYFPEHGVRYIAINDGFDSISPCNDIAPFKNIINEMYARDTSKKIRSAFTTKMKEGSFIGNFAPYGYRKDPDDKNRFLIDYEVAPVVQEMFHMAESGTRPAEIAHILNARRIAPPAVYRCEKRPYLDINHYSQRKEWTSAAICKMLRNVAYLGHMAQGKTTKVSFKSHIVLTNGSEDWFIVENTHEPLISQETFDIVRQRSVSRQNKPTGNFQNIFSGIARCMDCGRNMSTTGTRKRGCIANLVCGRYKLYGSKECSNHFIDYETLYDVVLGEIRKQVYLTQAEKQSILNTFSDPPTETGTQRAARTALQSLEARTQALDHIIQQLYEDRIDGKLSEERFVKMLESYEAEQKTVAERMRQLAPKKEDPLEESFLKFFQLVEDITDVQALTVPLLHKLIDHIEIGQGVKAPDGQKQQTVRIFYRFIGSISAQSIA